MIIYNFIRNPAVLTATWWACVTSLAIVALVSIQREQWPESILFRSQYVSPPVLYDLKVCLWGSERLANGEDALTSPPDSIRGYYYNYPRVWKCLAIVGLKESHASVVGSALAVLMLGTAGWWLQPRTWLAWFIGIALLLSPAVLNVLAMGNNEIIVWLLILTAGMLHRSRWRTVAPILLAVASVLKITPISALAINSRFGPQPGRILSLLLCAVLFGMFATRNEELARIAERTPQPHHRSFGAAVPALRIADASLRSPELANTVQRFGGANQIRQTGTWLARAFAAAIVILSALRAARIATPPPQISTSLACFAYGSSIYVAAFIIGTNYVYREIHLLLLVPALLHSAWASYGERTALLSSLIATVWAPLFPTGTAFILAQLPSWLLLGLATHATARYAGILAPAHVQCHSSRP